MTKLYIAMEDSLAVVNGQGDQWTLEVPISATRFECVAVDPHNPNRVYGGTYEKGLWRSSDAGATWEQVGTGIPHKMVMSVAVSPAERVGGYGVVWAGTEPSALFRSEDGGDTWQERPALLDLPSKPTWKFPPRPYTHHVRWIQPDPKDVERIFVAIELGGVMRSLDKGLTWEDRKAGAQLDGHTLRMHPGAPGRLYETAGGEDGKFRPRMRLAIPPVEPRMVIQGGGYAETQDAGSTWKTITDGLDGNHYLWGLAVDPGDPNTIVASAAVGPIQAHVIANAESYIIRRTAGQPWQRVNTGLPAPKGTLISVLTTNDVEPGVFYAANNKGVFRSTDAGQTWNRLNIAWSERYAKLHPNGIVAIG